MDIYFHSWVVTAIHTSRSISQLRLRTKQQLAVIRSSIQWSHAYDAKSGSQRPKKSGGATTTVKEKLHIDQWTGNHG